MIEFKIEMENDYLSKDNKDSLSKKEYYPKLYVSDMKESDGLELGEWTEVVAKFKKCEMTVSETESGKKYCCTYEVKGFSPIKNKESDFGRDLEKMMEG